MKDVTDRINALMAIIESKNIKDNYTKTVAETELVGLIYGASSSRLNLNREKFKKRKS